MVRDGLNALLVKGRAGHRLAADDRRFAELGEGGLEFFPENFDGCGSGVVVDLDVNLPLEKRCSLKGGSGENLFSDVAGDLGIRADKAESERSRGGIRLPENHAARCRATRRVNDAGDVHDEIGRFDIGTGFCDQIDAAFPRDPTFHTHPKTLPRLGNESRSILSAGGQFTGQADGVNHGGWIRLMFPGDAKSRAVIGAGARDGEAEGDVDGGVKIEEFQRNQTLIVIHRDDRVEIAQRRVAENRVGDSRTGKLGEAGLVQAVDGRLDNPHFFVTESSVFAGVGVKSGDGDSGLGDSSPFQEVGGQLADADDFFFRQQFRNAGERFVNRCQTDAQGGAGEQHSVIFHAKSIGEKFRLSGKGKTESLKVFLRNRSGDDRLGTADFELVDRFVEGVQSGASGRFVRFSGNSGRAVAEDREFKTGG
jgi:hypothetical protein